MNATFDPTNSTAMMCPPPEEDPYKAAKLFNFFLTLCIGSFGLVGNSIVVAVNRRIKNISSTDIYITLLAITDNVIIISVSMFALRYAYPLLMPTEDLNYQAQDILFRVGMPLKVLFQCLNTYTIVMLNLDRFVQVKFLVRSKAWCTPRRAMIYYTVAVIGSVMLSIPRALEFSVPAPPSSEPENPCARGYQVRLGWLGKDETYQLVYRYIIYGLMLYIIPLVILTITNVTLISTLYKRRKWLNSMKVEFRDIEDRELRLRKNEISAIVTLITVTLVFMVCQLPDMVIQYVWKLARGRGPTISMFAYQILIINSSVNFIIYAISSSVFRRRLKKVFRRRPDWTSSTFQRST